MFCGIGDTWAIHTIGTLSLVHLVEVTELIPMTQLKLIHEVSHLTVLPPGPPSNTKDQLDFELRRPTSFQFRIPASQPIYKAAAPFLGAPFHLQSPAIGVQPAIARIAGSDAVQYAEERGPRSIPNRLRT